MGGYFHTWLSITVDPIIYYSRTCSNSAVTSCHLARRSQGMESIPYYYRIINLPSLLIIIMSYLCDMKAGRNGAEVGLRSLFTLYNFSGCVIRGLSGYTMQCVPIKKVTPWVGLRSNHWGYCKTQSFFSTMCQSFIAVCARITAQ